MDELFEPITPDETISAEILPLPEGKSKHFFISFCNEDNEKVLPCIDEIENRFNLKCMHAERDFQAGKDISVNIQEGMLMSAKVILFLSPSFLQSGWCKYETDVAFVTSMGCGYSCIVPVLLEECQIPPTLVTLTYIDATIPGVDIPAKIASSLLRPNTDDGLLTLNIRSWNRTFENGYCHILHAERDNVWSCRPARYTFKMEPHLLNKLRENGVELPKALMKKAFGMVNKDSVMWSYDYLNRCKNFGWSCLILLPICFLLFFLVTSVLRLQYQTRKPSEQKDIVITDSVVLFSAQNIMFLVLPGLFLLMQIPICFLPRLCHRKKRDISVQSKLWQLTRKQCIQNNVILLFTSRRNQLPTLHVMKYNVTRCRAKRLSLYMKVKEDETMEYFIGVIKARNIQPIDTRMTQERYADKLIERHLEEMTKTLADDFDLLPDAPLNRHNVKQSKMCICQQLELNLI